jgi:hypothetical protein
VKNEGPVEDTLIPHAQDGERYGKRHLFKMRCSECYNRKYLFSEDIQEKEGELELGSPYLSDAMSGTWNI